ncbi:MAG: alcohol dehydrogenase catalytic domain-containing protein, partial [Thermoanaerobaculia bacterium]
GARFYADYPRPAAAPGEALVRVLRAGICATDLELIKGYAGFRGVLGHEFVGRVESCDTDGWTGRRVVGTINLGCGSCAVCLEEGAEHCPERAALGIAGRDGAFAEYLALPAGNLLPVPEGLADDEAVFAEPLAAALRIPEQVEVASSGRVAVVGPGRLGLLIAQVLALVHDGVVVFGRSQRALQLPRRLGLETADVADAASDAWDLVVEATGNAAGLATALAMVRPRGTLVLKSTFAGAPAVDLTKLVVGEVAVVGSRCGPFAPALDLLANGSVRVRPLIEAEYPLADGLAALEHAARPGVRKVLLRPRG